MKTVIVLGMHRSGTSMVSGVLQLLGVDMGKELVGKLPSNPLGHFEDRAFLELNNDILSSAGGDPFTNIPSYEKIVFQKSKYEDRIRGLINQRSKCALWGWKDPRTCLTIELFVPYLINPFFIVCYRKSEEVADSLYRRGKMDIDMGFRIKELYDQRIDYFFKKYPNMLRYNVDFGGIRRDPVKTIHEIKDFLELDYVNDNVKNAIKFVKSKDEIQKMSKKIMLRQLISLGIKKPWKIPGYLISKISILSGNNMSNNF